jgi:hypothetical protein
LTTGNNERIAVERDHFNFATLGRKHHVTFVNLTPGGKNADNAVFIFGKCFALK